MEEDGKNHQISEYFPPEEIRKAEQARRRREQSQRRVARFIDPDDAICPWCGKLNKQGKYYLKCLYCKRELSRA